MAKFGEGDKRWIVQDRADGTNVHNWHWSETDCLEYSRSFFTSTLSHKPILTGQGGLHISTLSLDKLEGESYVNIRKGKIIPGYELSLSLSWEGEAKDEGGNSLLKSTGSVEIPYLSIENAGEVPEIKVTFQDSGPIGVRIKEAFMGKGKELVCQIVKEYEEAMAKGGPCKVGEGPNSPAPAPAPAPAQPKKEAAAATAAGGKTVEPTKKEKVKKERRGYRRIEMEERFRCRGGDLYEIMMDENRWKGFTQSNAKISKEVGGEFSIFDGSVVGSNVELKEGKCIVQKWRFASWPDGVFSTVKLTFEEPEPGVTSVKLVQTDVPEEDRYGNETVVENTERGWRDLIFQRIRVIFGFGL